MTKRKLEVGDPVTYSADFLKNTQQLHNGHKRGKVVQKKGFIGKSAGELIIVKWADYDKPQAILQCNLVHVDDISKEPH